MRTPKSGQSGKRPAARALVLLLTVMAGLLPWAAPAQAHGTIVDPASRAYQCWKTWGSDHMNPAMQQQDPMCWQAWQANSDTMWNWMSALRDGLGGQFQARTPDGQLCSNGLTRNDSLNRPGAWKTTRVSNNFTVHLYDQASHGADYFRVYVSKNSYNPATQHSAGDTWTSSRRPDGTPRPRTSRSTSTRPATRATTSCSSSGRPRTPTRLHVVQRHHVRLSPATPAL